MYGERDIIHKRSLVVLGTLFFKGPLTLLNYEKRLDLNIIDEFLSVRAPEDRAKPSPQYARGGLPKYRTCNRFTAWCLNVIVVHTGTAASQTGSALKAAWEATGDNLEMMCLLNT